MHLVEAVHTTQLAEPLRYSRFDQPPEQVPGRLPLPGTEPHTDKTSDHGHEAMP